MRDKAGNILKKADRVNFRNRPKNVREFIGGDDDVDIFRFKARSSSIDITASRLRNGDTVELYQAKKSLGRTLRKIGNTDFSQIPSRRLNRFLSSVDLTVASSGRKDTYSADVEKDTYFLVVSRDANRNRRYRLSFTAEDLDPNTNPVNNPGVGNPGTTPTPASIGEIIAGLTETSLYAQNNAGTAVPDDQNQLMLNQVPFSSTEVPSIAAGLSLPTGIVTPLLSANDLLATTDATETAVSNGVQLNTQVDASNTGYVGYTNYGVDYSSLNIASLSGDLTPVNPSGAVVLNSATGYVLSFDLAIATETSTSANRAGFSVVIVGNDASTAIELGFDGSGIFAQSANFTAAESFTPSTFSMSSTVSYDLYVSNAGYRLFANDTEILTGGTRTYNFDPAQSDPPLPVNPYTTQNFVFLGDNTDQASATFTLDNVSLFT